MAATDHRAVIESALRDLVGSSCVLSALVPVNGGSISTCYRAEANQGNFFVKIGSMEWADVFAAEVDGLEALNRTDTFVVPAVIGMFRGDAQTSLILQHLDL